MSYISKKFGIFFQEIHPDFLPALPMEKTNHLKYLLLVLLSQSQWFYLCVCLYFFVILLGASDGMNCQKKYCPVREELKFKCTDKLI